MNLQEYLSDYLSDLPVSQSFNKHEGTTSFNVGI